MLQESIAVISRQLVDTPTGRTDSALRTSLRILLRALPADRVTLHLREGAPEDGDPFQVHASESSARTDSLPIAASFATDDVALPLERLPWLATRLEKLEAVEVSALSQLPCEASAERVHQRELGLASWFVTPIVERSQLVGVLEVRSLRRSQGWSPGSLALLQVVADLSIAALRRQREAERIGEHAQVEALGRAAGGVAHDFNNFLTAILGYCDLLEGDLPTGAPRDDLEEIRVAATHAGGLVEQILRCTRRCDDAASGVDPNAALRSLQRLIRRIAGERVHVRFELAEASSRVALAPSAFDQIVVNLVSNARDAMPRGGVLSIATASVELAPERAQRLDIEPGAYTRLKVRDEGSGMDERTLRHLFEPLFTTKQSEHGTGLGLATVASILERVGGAIEVESEPGRGSVFRLWLPSAAAPCASSDDAREIHAGVAA